MKLSQIRGVVQKAGWVLSEIKRNIRGVEMKRNFRPRNRKIKKRLDPGNLMLLIYVTIVLVFLLFGGFSHVRADERTSVPDKIQVVGGMSPGVWQQVPVHK